MDPNLLANILEISRQMAETRALEPLLFYIVDEAIKLVGAERGYIVLVQPNGSLNIRVRRGRNGEQLENGEDLISKSVFERVVESGEPLILRDAMNDPSISGGQSVSTLKLRSVICVPLLSREKAIGVIYVENRSVCNRFKEDDLIPLVFFASQAAVAIENAALNDELEARVSACTRELERSWSELVEANRMRTVWLSNFSHDLGAPLGIVTTTLSALERGSFGELNPEQLERVEKALKAMEHSQSLISNLFTLFKLEENAVTLRPERVILKRFLKNVYDVASGLPWSPIVTLNLDISEPLPDIYIDPVRIRQVLLNLLSNAHKFTIKGSVTIHARYLAAQDEVQIGVSDTGEGIASDKLGRLFQRFQQVDDNQERRREGSGLGLAICRELVEMHGGRITVESTLGVGSDFIITLPLTRLLGLNKPPISKFKAFTYIEDLDLSVAWVDFVRIPEAELTQDAATPTNLL